VRNRLASLVLFAAAVALPGGGAPAAAGAPAVPAADAAAAQKDPLTADIRHWAAYLKDNPAQDENWQQVKQVSEPILQRIERALQDGHRLLALQRLAVVRGNLAASEWAEGRPPGARADLAAFEAEWKRMGPALGKALAPPRPDDFAGMRPAALRAVAEAAAAQVRVFYNASLDYGRSTEPQYGLFYLGQAQAATDLVALCRRLDRSGSLVEGAPRRPPSLRPLQPELDALETDLLATYKPPVSIDRHGEFIVASSALNEARALDTAGLRSAALLRYLDAALRTSALRPAPAIPMAATLGAGSKAPADAAAAPPSADARLQALQERIDASGSDASIARIYLESARSNLQADAPGANPATAEAIVADVLPRYLAAVGPPPEQPPPKTPRVTVTLVRWPFT
jgi:hypothetical protein